MFEGLINLNDYTISVGSPAFEQVVLAAATLIAGVIIAKLAATIIEALNNRFNIEPNRVIKSISRLFELFIIVLSIIIALNFLEVNSAKIIIQSLLNSIPAIIIILLLLFLGFILINLIVDILKRALLRIGLSEYLYEVGISVEFINNTFTIVKIFLFLVLFSVSFSFVGLTVPFIDNLLVAVIYGFVLLSVALIYNIFKDPLSNFFMGAYVEKNLLKPGQHIMLGDEAGEVIGFTPHGVLIRLPNGYNLLYPHAKLVKQKIYIKRTKQDITRLEALRSNFVAQIPAHCGPASAAMMLSFFEYDVSQEKIGELAKTKTPGGTGPRKLIEAVKNVTNSNVKGVLVKYDEISDLKEEMKSWLSEGALVLLWFHKPALFRHSKSKGHYVLCVGVEGSELIIMDPSKSTAGVYLIDYNLLEEAMSEIDKKRGYIVFAKQGTSAYWRISEGLVYADVSLYRELSKSFERYLKKILRQNEAINQLLSEHVFKALGKSNRPVRVWKPEQKETENKN